MSELNEKLENTIKRWDPLGLGEESYETEIVDVIQAVYEINDSRYLAKRIQFIFEFSFKKLIPLKECIEIAERLLYIKEASSCTLS